MLLHNHPEVIPKSTPYTTSDPRVSPKCPKSHPARRVVRTVGVLRPILTSKTRRQNVYFLFMDPLGPNTRRYDTHLTCKSTSIFPKVTPKSPSHAKSDRKSDTKSTSALYKIMKICWDNMCFLKMHFDIPKVTSQSSQSDPKATQSHPHIPKVTPE